MSPWRIYVSGPMTGMPELNFPLFNRCAAQLRHRGFAVVNPAEITIGADARWDVCLRADIRELVGCSALAMLPGWEQSKGARLEHHIGVELGLTILPFEDWIALPIRSTHELST